VNAGPGQYAVLSTLVFAIGLFGVLNRRTPFAVLAALALTFLAPVIALAGFAHTGTGGQVPPVGDAFGLLAVVAACAQVAAGMGLVLLARRRLGRDVADDIDDVTG
jgi:NADH-quinone oxidoreductase subunit K